MFNECWKLWKLGRYRIIQRMSYGSQPYVVQYWWFGWETFTAQIKGSSDVLDKLSTSTYNTTAMYARYIDAQNALATYLAYKNPPYMPDKVIHEYKFVEGAWLKQL
jgi:hypothetical protein